jgi:hypothetical protein
MHPCDDSGGRICHMSPLGFFAAVLLGGTTTLVSTFAGPGVAVAINDGPEPSYFSTVGVSFLGALLGLSAMLVAGVYVIPAE